jgi:hypothetical protein
MAQVIECPLSKCKAEFIPQLHNPLPAPKDSNIRCFHLYAGSIMKPAKYSLKKGEGKGV